jgi:hypothetical protein
VEERLPLVQEMAHRRYVGAPERRAARAPAGAAGQEPTAQRRDSGLPDGQDHGGGRPRARLRPRQASGREKTTPLGGHRGTGTEGAAPQRKGPTPTA